FDPSTDVLDWDMWVRVAAHGPVWYEPEPLALYRVRGGGVTDRMVTTGSNVRGLREVIRRNQALLPRERADAITAAALEDTVRTRGAIWWIPRPWRRSRWAASATAAPARRRRGASSTAATSRRRSSGSS